MKRERRIPTPVTALGIFVLMLLPINITGQSYSYRTYDLTNGLPGTYLNTIGQDSEGFLWIGLETGLFRFDGFEFHEIDLPDTLSTGYPSSIFCDNKGVMWIGYTDGSLFTWSPGSSLKRIPIEADRINRIMAGPDGRSWIVTQQSGIYVSGSADDDAPGKLTTPEGIVIFDVSIAGKDSLLVATQDNLYLCKKSGDQVLILSSFPELEYIWIQSLAALPGKRWAVGTDGSGLFIASAAGGVLTATQVTGEPSLDGVRIPALLSGDDNNLFAATRESGMVKVRFNDDFSAAEAVNVYNSETGLSDNDVKTLFRDREGNLWIGLFNLGLAAITTNAFSFYVPGKDKEISFIGESQGKIVLGTRNGLYDFDPVKGIFSNYRELNRKTGGSGITAWKADTEGNVWVGTATDGLWVLNAAGTVKPFWKTINPGQNHINGIDLDSRNIWLATLDGVILVDKISGRQKKVFTTTELLPHNKASQVFTVRDDEVLVATETDRLCYLHADSGIATSPLIMEGATKNDIQSIFHDSESGITCVGTLGNGLFRFEGDTLMNILTFDGLLSNYCYSVLLASDGRIWTGHERGFSIVNTEAGVIRTFTRDFGVTGDCLPNAITETSDRKIFIGTTDGIVAYDPEMEQKDPVPPQAGIVSVTINNITYPYSKTFSLPYRSSYTIEVRYAGISLRDPLNVSFRTMLENLDEEWSKPTGERTITYKLRDGHYKFIVEASSRDNVKDSTTASFDIVIQKPFFRQWWFIIAMIVVAAGVVYIIILLRERAHRIQREYLEGELRKRTAEVHAQKEELFQKNQDITESIKYAKRIQSSVLPDINRLRTVFNDAFVFFLPRDIVSGDFFWFDWIDKERFIVVCADSTGHGVPGAFMSMIGSALLQDIITRKKIVKPSQILLELDRRIFSTLNQNQEVEAANDGMDIVVCEFNVKTRHLVFASAMRPVILIIDGDQQYIRGNRSAIGGESVTEKFYDDQEYHLREGDIIYLFSDGYPDQFGGHGSKKMKISRLRSLIDEIKHLPMPEQQQRLRDYFFEWKGGNDQVDDVLMMGIRV